MSSPEIFQPMLIEQPAVEFLRVIEVDYKENSIHSLAIFAQVRLSIGGHRPHLNRAAYLRTHPVHRSSVKKVELSSPTELSGRQREKV